MSVRLRRACALLLALGLLASGTRAQQLGPFPGYEPAVVHRDGVALEGYDAVAYLRDNEARRGLPIFEVEYAGYRWHFESDLNAARFSDDPQRYIPAYGGYSSIGVAEGYLSPGDPEVWSIRDGRVYLFFSHSLRRRWLDNAGEYIRQADRNWARISIP